MEFRFPGRDASVGGGEVDEGEEVGGLGDVQTFALDHILGDHVPVPRRRRGAEIVGPERRGQRLVFVAFGIVTGADLGGGGRRSGLCGLPGQLYGLSFEQGDGDSGDECTIDCRIAAVVCDRSVA